MANNESHWSSRGRQPRVAGLHEVDANTTLTVKVNALIRNLDLVMSNGQGVSSSSKIILLCETYGGGHVEEDMRQLSARL